LAIQKWLVFKRENGFYLCPLTPHLAAQLVDLRRFYDLDQIPENRRNLLFPWIHGNKQWYACWNAAEGIVGKRFRLHDLKRYSASKALEAGATPLELQQHLDHADIKTSTLFYTEAETAKLVRRLKIPFPDEQQRQFPMFTEPELKAEVEANLFRKLAEAGIDLGRLE
jgi:integrase